MKKALTALFLAATMVLTAGLAGCGGRAPGGDGGGGTTPGGNDTALKNFTMQANEYQSYSSYSVDKKDESGNVIGTGLTDYNKDLYYINEVKFAIADPSVIYVDHGEEEGYFYAYGTSDLIGGRGFQCWRSKDLTNWEYKGVCYRPDYNTCWDFTNHWAPEVIYDADLDKYLIFFNADWNERVGWGGGKESKHISVAYAEEPYGPFVQDNDEKPAYDFSTTNKLIKPELMRDNAIDVHPFVDPKTKQKYLYYSGYSTDGNGQNHPQTILGCRMKSWSEPDYSSIVELTRYNSSVVDRDLADMGEGDGVNEGPFVWYKDGTYFLTFSTYGFTNSNYQVRQAVSDSPLGPFTKVHPTVGGTILATEAGWESIQSAGHHCYITCGDELMIAYHTFMNRTDISGGRALAVDRVNFVENQNGQLLMHANGPTYSFQPLPEEVTGYKNLAPKATFTCNNAKTGADISALNDEVLKIHGGENVNEFEMNNGSVTIDVKFDNFVKVRSIIIYNSIYYGKAFRGIDNIRLTYKNGANSTAVATIAQVPFDWYWNTDSTADIAGSVIFPGASSIVELPDIPIKGFTVTFFFDPSVYDEGAAINDIWILGKEAPNAAPWTARKDYKLGTYEEVNSLPLPVESENFGFSGAFNNYYGFDVSHDSAEPGRYVDKDWTGNTQELYFKGVHTTDFYAEVSMSVLDKLRNYEGDPYPKFGLMMRTQGHGYFFYHIVADTMNTEKVGYVQSNYGGTDYDWEGTHRTLDAPGIAYTGTNYTKLGLARYGNKIYMFVNDRLVKELVSGSEELMNINLADHPSSVALLSYNHFVRYKDYSIIDGTGEGKAEVVAKLTTLGVTGL